MSFGEAVLFDCSLVRSRRPCIKSAAPGRLVSTLEGWADDGMLPFFSGRSSGDSSLGQARAARSRRATTGKGPRLGSKVRIVGCIQSLGGGGGMGILLYSRTCGDQQSNRESRTRNKRIVRTCRVRGHASTDVRALETSEGLDGSPLKPAGADAGGGERLPVFGVGLAEVSFGSHRRAS